MDGVAGVLETALYYPHTSRDEVLRFYDETLGMRRVAGWDDGTAYRLGPGVLLLFDRDLVAERDGPVADHGAEGRGHVCFRAEPGAYDEVRERLAGRGVGIAHDHEWSEGRRSFYFKDPAGNLLEVADSDLWLAGISPITSGRSPHGTSSAAPPPSRMRPATHAAAASMSAACAASALTEGMAMSSASWSRSESDGGVTAASLVRRRVRGTRHVRRGSSRGTGPRLDRP